MTTPTRRPRVWLATLALSAGVLTLAQGTRTAAAGAGAGAAADAKRESGIYLESGETAGKEEPKRLTAVMAQVTPEGLGASMATMGFKKPKMISKIGGDKASLRVPAQSTFLFVFGAAPARGPSPDMNPADFLNNQNSAMSQLPAHTSSPKDYMLIVLTSADGERVYNSGNGQQVKCAVEKLDSKVFRIKPETALAPGEYGFTLSQGGGAAGVLWDFGVDGTATK